MKFWAQELVIFGDNIARDNIASSTMDRYTYLHRSPEGPGDARPTADQIIVDEGLVGKLGDKVIFVTGGTSGLGRETAKALHATGAKIYITSRCA